MPSVMSDVKKEINAPVRCYIEETDPQTVIFEYSHNFEDVSILPVIRLEIGALAAWTPTENKDISPYVAQYYPHLFRNPTTNILTVLPQRTFWEKVTILHKEAYRPESKGIPSRYSRHYYDMFCMLNSVIKEQAMTDTDLLNKVVDFKNKFYRCAWARYDLAKIGTLKLMPPKNNLLALKDDYSHMQNMIFGNKPSFAEIMTKLGQFEKEINESHLNITNTQR